MCIRRVEVLYVVYEDFEDIKKLKKNLKVPIYYQGRS